MEKISTLSIVPTTLSVIQYSRVCIYRATFQNILEITGKMLTKLIPWKENENYYYLHF